MRFFIGLAALVLFTGFARAEMMEATLLRDQKGFQPVGFNSEGFLVGYFHNLNFFTVYNLEQNMDSPRGWKVEEPGRFISGALSADGKLLAAAFLVDDRNGTTKIFDSNSGEEIGVKLAARDAAFVAFSADGKTLAAVSAEGGLRLFDLKTGELKASKPLPRPMQVSWTGVEFSPDGKHVAAQNSYTKHIWEVEKMEVVGGMMRMFLGISRDWQLGYAPEGLVSLKDPSNPKPAQLSLPAEATNRLNWLCISPDSRFLAVHSEDKEIRFWDMKTGESMGSRIKNDARMIHMEFSPDNRFLVTHQPSGLKGPERLVGTVSIWEVASGRLVSTPAKMEGMFRSWHFDKEGRFMAAWYHGMGNSAQIWKLPSRKAGVQSER